MIVIEIQRVIPKVEMNIYRRYFVSERAELLTLVF